MRFFYNLFKLLLRMDHRLATLNATVQAFSEAHQPLTTVTPEKYIGDQEVMQQLHWSKSTLQRRRTDGTLPYTKIKGKYYYREADISKMMGTGY